MSNTSETRSTTVHSVDRAISILQVLARRGAIGVTPIAEELGVHKSTVFRLLATLEARGLVEQNSTRGHYQLGYGVIQLAAGATRKHDISVTSRPICMALADAVGETVNIVINDGAEAITIDQVIGSAEITSVNWVGQRSPLHTTASGKVFLATMPAEERRKILEGGLERYTEKTVVDPERLEEQLAEVRELGYAFSVDEHEIGLTGVAAPIRSLGGGVIAAVVASGPSFRITAEKAPELAEHVLAAAAAISERNGFPKAE
ncbi:IclR family transcriptional regulator [Nocardioides sp. NPDC051685]|uniref:IclR family transcriptional regulator n=1 Tax=Nocardioides sp. NPDC051685 TaxID=3364334 RepID=UPI0037B9BE1A